VAALISPSNQPTTPAPASSSPNPVAAADTNENKKCSRYSGCAHLANDCCPTKAGVMLVSSCRMTNLKIQIVEIVEILQI
jgi:hypothetical protein